jgi:hypothetical protein
LANEQERGTEKMGEAKQNTARPDGNRERAAEVCKTALKPNCPIVLRSPPFPRKSHLNRAPYVVLRAQPSPWAVIGPPRPGDHRTPVERWQDFHFEWEAHFYG